MKLHKFEVDKHYQCLNSVGKVPGVYRIIRRTDKSIYVEGNNGQPVRAIVEIHQPVRGDCVICGGTEFSHLDPKKLGISSSLGPNTLFADFPAKQRKEPIRDTRPILTGL